MVEKTKHACCLQTIQPVNETLSVINGKWKLSIIISVGIGNYRFTDIQKSIPGLSPKVLAKELKDLESHLLIVRTIIEDYPVKVQYTVAKYAETLSPIINAMRDWGLNHQKTMAANTAEI